MTIYVSASKLLPRRESVSTYVENLVKCRVAPRLRKSTLHPLRRTLGMANIRRVAEHELIFAHRLHENPKKFISERFFQVFPLFFLNLDSLF